MTTLVLGPSLGTTLATCWGPTIDVLRADADLDVRGLELPGHGTDRSAPVSTIGELAARVLGAVDGPFLYAGDSVGGQVGLELMLQAPDRVLGAVLCCTGARIGTADGWAERVAQVEASGTAGLVAATAARWFAPSFVERHPDRASALLHALRDTTDDGYIAVCRAIAAYDVRARLADITTAVVAVAGAVDPVCPPALLTELADGVPHGRLVVLDDVAHQAPAERPDRVAAEIRTLLRELT